MHDLAQWEAQVVAGADLVGRAGARDFEIGYLHDDVPVEEAAWWAAAHYQGARLQVDNQPSPAHAAHALAVRVLSGAACKCGELVALNDDAEGCRWRLVQPGGPQTARWQSSCDAPAIEMKAGQRGDMAAMNQAMDARRQQGPNRAQRRAQEKAQRRGKDYLGPLDPANDPRPGRWHG